VWKNSGGKQKNKQYDKERDYRSSPVNLCVLHEKKEKRGDEDRKE
jgi:hypothetical protein